MPEQDANHQQTNIQTKDIFNSNKNKRQANFGACGGCESLTRPSLNPSALSVGDQQTLLFFELSFVIFVVLLGRICFKIKLFLTSSIIPFIHASFYAWLNTDIIRSS